MRIYNSLARKKQEIKEKTIGMYVCGPTVYDEPHIGHARSAYVFDVIVRYFRYRGFKVKFVRNITDIDDKIINRARSEAGKGDLKEAARNIALKYIKSYHEDMKLLGLISPDKEPKATETIPDMIRFVKDLIDRGFAYESSGNVYFEVKKFKEYGALSGQSLDEMEEGVRVSLDKNKKDPLDFALWKRAKEDEPSWDSPWGKGRPGWHIECSVMSTKFLGKDFLIHGGGLDLIFPHHENEVAQTVAAGKKSAKYWIHNGLLTIDSQKMSKSLGNFISIKDFLSKHKDPGLLKLLFLSSHYRHPVDYTEDKIEEMAKMKERITIFLGKTDKLKGKKKKIEKNIKKINIIKEKFIKSMDDDFNTPEGLSHIFELILEGNVCLNEGDEKGALYTARVIKELCVTLGLSLKASNQKLGHESMKLIEERNQARKAKDFKKADRIRKALLKKGIVIEDTKEGTAWRRKL